MLSATSLSSAAIAQFIRYFNLTSALIMSALAAYGVYVLILRQKTPRRPALNGLIPAFAIAALLAVAAEALIFNYGHYLKPFGGEEFTISGLENLPAQKPAISDTTVDVEITGTRGDDNAVTEVAVKFVNANRKITSVHIRPLFKNREKIDVSMRWSDTSNYIESVWGCKRTLYKALPHENHIAVHAVGNVTEFEIVFQGGALFEGEIAEIGVNKRIPLYFSGLRVFAASLLFFALIIFIHKPLRAKAAFYLLEYKFDPANEKQNLAYIGMVVLIILFTWLCVYTTDMGESVNEPIHTQYSKYLVDAIINRKASIDFGRPEKLLDAERPYNNRWLWGHEIYYGTDMSNDVAWYKGKYYVYYGVVPAALLYVPYKLFTGKYMSHHGGVFAFSAVAVVFLALLWRLLVRKYMPDARFAFFMLGFAALFFASYFFGAVRFPTTWTIVQIGGVAFLAAGTFLLFKSVENEKTNGAWLFLGCLSLALSVGCRPDMVCASVLVPAVLWKRRSWKLALFVVAPYLMVALPLMAYNYVRFESVFEFGQKYCIVPNSGVAIHLLNPLAKIHRGIVTLIFYLFRLYVYSLRFPFVELPPPTGHMTNYYGFMFYYNTGGGLVNIPILFCLFYLFKNIIRKGGSIDGLRAAAAFFAAGVGPILIFSVLGMFHARYLLDSAFFLVLSSLFCAYYWSGAVGKKTFGIGQDGGAAAIDIYITSMHDNGGGGGGGGVVGLATLSVMAPLSG